MAALLPVLAVLAVPAALAQAPQPEPAPRQSDLTLGVALVAPRAMGTIEATLLDGTGSPFTLFRVRRETGPGLGLEAHLGTAVSRRVDVEMSTTWLRFDARAVTSGDAEGVPGATLTETLTRLSVEGAVLWRFAGNERVQWFLRGGGGWMRELPSDRSVVEDGWVATAGMGMKYWLSRTPAGLGRFGLRAEFRVLARTDGLPIDDARWRMWPVAAGSVMFGF